MQRHLLMFCEFDITLDTLTGMKEKSRRTGVVSQCVIEISNNLYSIIFYILCLYALFNIIYLM